MTNNTEHSEKENSVTVLEDSELGRIEVLRHEDGIVATNGHLGGWTKERDGTLVSVEYANTLNRAQRRKRGIKL